MAWEDIDSYYVAPKRPPYFGDHGAVILRSSKRGWALLSIYFGKRNYRRAVSLVNEKTGLDIPF